MYSSVLSPPVRRTLATAAAAVALAAVGAALAPDAFAGPAGPTSPAPRHGTATATVLRTGLDVSVLHRALVPLDVTLDDVHAPADASRTTLSVRLDGFDGGRPFGLFAADVATARATADPRAAHGYADLVDARVTLPGLPLPLVGLRQVTSQADCAAHRRPAAHSDVLGPVTVLGERVTLTAGGTTTVDVPAVGRVRLTLSRPRTTSHTAAATALDLAVSIDPLGLGVTAVHGDVTLARATCRTPSGTPGGGSSGGTGTGGSGNGGAGTGGSGSGGPSSGGTTGTGGNGGASSGGSGTGGSSGVSGGGSSSGATGTGGAAGSGGGIGTAPASTGGVQTLTPTGQDHGLADTGADPGTPYLAAGAATLLAAGGTAVYLSRRRRGRAGR